jgi:hypothetical protein
MTDIVENEQLPDWLVELRDQQIREQSEPQPPLPEEQQEQIDQASLAEDLRTQMARAEEQMAEAETQAPFAEEPAAPVEPAPPPDLLDDLREQMMMAEDVLEDEQRASSLQVLSALKPTQRLLLAVLLFLNVAICGCMILIMAGRVELPF